MNPKHFRPFTCKPKTSKKLPGLTSFGGLPLFHQALRDFGLIDEMKKIYLKRAGHEDHVLLEALILLLCAGGRHVSDWDYLMSENGFLKMFGADVAVDALERYLKRLTVNLYPQTTEKGNAGYTTMLEQLHQQLLQLAWKLAGKPKNLTLDVDTTVIETDKRDALYCYEKVKAYQPMMAYCPELHMVLAYEFRDGNISPSTGYARIIERCRKALPDVEKWTVRSDSAGYQHKLMAWMNKQKMLFYMTVDQSRSISDFLYKEKLWQPLMKQGVKTDQEIAEIPYVPACSNQKKMIFISRCLRFIAIRKPLDTRDLFGERYSYGIIVTNDHKNDLTTIVRLHYGRCGSIEYANQQVKDQCGQEVMPSNDFAANCAWFSLGCFAHNFMRLMQTQVLPEQLKNCEIHSLRFRLIRSAAVIAVRSRQIIVNFCRGNPVYRLYCKAKESLEMAVLRLQMV
jgi:hypothetical protein